MMQRGSNRSESLSGVHGSISAGGGRPGIASGSVTRDHNRSGRSDPRQQDEITELRSELEEARKLIDILAKAGAPSGTKKRSRMDVNGGSLVASESMDSEADARAEKLRIELEECRILREKEKQKFEVKLGEMESSKGKLLRQLKFLSQEEENARAEHKSKQESLVAESRKLQAGLRADRTELQEARKRVEQLYAERQSLRRKIEREVTGRHVLEERLATTEAQLECRAAEVAEFREEARGLQDEKSRLSSELASMRRASGADESPTALGDQDTPVARNLRAQIRSWKREARRWESTAQELKEEIRSAATLQEELNSLQEKLKRTEASLHSSLREQASQSAIVDEKEEWSMLFAKVMEEHERLAGAGVRGKDRGKVKDEEGRGGGGETRVKATPLGALRMLREIQEEKTGMMKELASLRLRQRDSEVRLEDAQRRLQEESGRADKLRAEGERTRSGLEDLRRRCRSAELEAIAQKELIQSYERDTFRKPASEGWLSDHARMQAALDASKQEVRSLRAAAEGQLSEVESSRMKARTEKAEAALAAALQEKKETMRQLEKVEQELAMHEKQAANGTDGSRFKVLHMVNNPAKAARASQEAHRKRELEVLREENARLLQQVESAGQGSAADSSMSMSVLMDGPPGMRGSETPDERKFSQRLQQIFKRRTEFYREAVYLLTGYKIDIEKDPSRKVLSLRSMYAENEGDCLKFQYANDELDLLETPFAMENTDKVSIFLSKCHSIPAFLSTLTLDLFEKQTHMGTMRF